MKSWRRKYMRLAMAAVAGLYVLFVGYAVDFIGAKQQNEHEVRQIKDNESGELGFYWINATKNELRFEKTVAAQAKRVAKSSKSDFSFKTKGESRKLGKIFAKTKIEVAHKNNSYGELTCEEIRELLQEAFTSENSELRKENDFGNRGVYFSSIERKDGEVVNLVLKLASLPDPEYRLQTHLYRYRTAIKEIETLLELQRLNWTGVPRIYGACVTENKVVYAVNRVFGKPLCRGLGLDMSCAVARDLTSHINATPDPGLSTLTFLSKATCFFEQFERFHVFMEDISGTNVFYNENTFDIFVVDADSFIFYEDTPLNSRTSCKINDDCPLLKGNFWNPASLNMKIYALCREMKGDCKNNVCRGVDSSLHTCGIAKWLVLTMKFSVPRSSYDVYKKTLHCMMLSDPRKRCTLKEACSTFTNELERFRREKLKTTKQADINQTLNIKTTEQPTS